MNLNIGITSPRVLAGIIGDPGGIIHCIKVNFRSRFLKKGNTELWNFLVSNYEREA